MIMRYHWGLAIGHTYAHNRPINILDVSTAPEPSQVHDGDVFPDVMNFEEPDKNTGDKLEFTLKNLKDDLIPEEVWDDNDLLVAAGDDGDVDLDAYREMYG